MTFYIGLMSGTSMDGIDAALVDIPSNKLLYGMTKQYSNDLKRRIDEAVNAPNITFASLCQLNTLIGREFADAANNLLQESNVRRKEIKAIGSHGQTVCHDTSVTIPYTLQLGCGHTISSRTGITVVADFRTRDLVNGGQGAPFAPLYHQELFSKTNAAVGLVNIGGISNITFIAPGHPTEGWDVGPGNCLMDAWIYKHQGKLFDAGGSWANQGVVIKPLLEQLLQDSFFALTPPKSIGKEYFSLSWLEAYLNNDYKAVDVQATLLNLTALSIVKTILNRENELKQLYLCGGGTHNEQLKKTISDLLPEVKVMSTDEAGFNADYIEAMMFAWLASQTINQESVNLTAITGSRGPQILGAIYPVINSY